MLPPSASPPLTLVTAPLRSVFTVTTEPTIGPTISPSMPFMSRSPMSLSGSRPAGAGVGAAGGVLPFGAVGEVGEGGTLVGVLLGAGLVLSYSAGPSGVLSVILMLS